MDIRCSGLGLGALLAWLPAALACPTLPAPVRDLDIPRYYDDKQGTRVDPQLKARHTSTTAPLVEFVRAVAASADRATGPSNGERRQAAARCALTALETWARAGAWLGRVSQQGEYQRKWDLAGVALAYVKVRPYSTPEQRGTIEPWLGQVAQAARAFFDNPGRKRNNHWYWLGLAFAGVAVGTDDERYWAEARGIFRDAARDIDERGALAMEMERGARALHYHAFSAMPLVMLAEMAAARGEDWYGERNGALHRLVDLTARGFREPQLFGQLAGVPQELSPSSAGAGWMVLYARRFPTSAAKSLQPMRLGHRLLGGDVDRLLLALSQSVPAR